MSRVQRDPPDTGDSGAGAERGTPLPRSLFDCHTDLLGGRGGGRERSTQQRHQLQQILPDKRLLRLAFTGQHSLQNPVTLLLDSAIHTLWTWEEVGRRVRGGGGGGGGTHIEKWRHTVQQVLERRERESGCHDSHQIQQSVSESSEGER